MKALLIRIGIDLESGGWNAPVDADGRFVYVPIPEERGTAFHPGLERRYGEVLPALHRTEAGDVDLRAVIDRVVEIDRVRGVLAIARALIEGCGEDNVILTGLVSGMGTAFSASLFGLSGSLILGFLDLQAGQAQGTFYNDLEDWLSTVTDLDPDLIEGRGGAGTTAEDLRVAIERLSRAISEGGSGGAAGQPAIGSTQRATTAMANSGTSAAMKP